MQVVNVMMQRNTQIACISGNWYPRPTKTKSYTPYTTSLREWKGPTINNFMSPQPSERLLSYTSVMITATRIMHASLNNKPLNL